MNNISKVTTNVDETRKAGIDPKLFSSSDERETKETHQSKTSFVILSS